MSFVISRLSALAIILTILGGIVGAIAHGSDSSNGTNAFDQGKGVRSVSNNTATSFIRFTCPSTNGGSLVLHYSVRVRNSTDGQVETGVIHLSALNKSGTFSIGQTTVGAIQAKSTGTLTVTFGTTTTATTFDLQATVNSTLTSITVEEIGFWYDACANATPKVDLP